MTDKNRKTKNGSQPQLALSIWLHTHTFSSEVEGHRKKNKFKTVTMPEACQAELPADGGALSL